MAQAPPNALYEMGFGYGSHYCRGFAVAKAEMEDASLPLTHRLHGTTLDGDVILDPKDGLPPQKWCPSTKGQNAQDVFQRTWLPAAILTTGRRDLDTPAGGAGISSPYGIRWAAALRWCCGAAFGDGHVPVQRY
jgi:hypothetical protein